MRLRKMVVLGFGDAEIEPGELDALRNRCERLVQCIGEESAVAELADADALVLPPGGELGSELLRHAPRLAWVGVLGTDTSGLDVAALDAAGVTRAHVQGYSTESVAEFVFAALLDHMRGLERARAHAARGDFTSRTLARGLLRGQRFGVVGLGRIGQRVAEVAARGFGASVEYWSRAPKPGVEAALGARWQTLDALFARCSILSVHLPLTADTRGLVCAGLIDALPEDSLLVCLSPLDLLDLDAVERRLSRGEVSFLFDHGGDLAPDRLAQLSSHPRCVVYPPVAHRTPEATSERLALFLAQLDAFLRRA